VRAEIAFCSSYVVLSVSQTREKVRVPYRSHPAAPIIVEVTRSVVHVGARAGREPEVS